MTWDRTAMIEMKGMFFVLSLENLCALRRISGLFSYLSTFALPMNSNVIFCNILNFCQPLKNFSMAGDTVQSSRYPYVHSYLSTFLFIIN
jgi:hypothetical protein